MIVYCIRLVLNPSQHRGVEVRRIELEPPSEYQILFAFNLNYILIKCVPKSYLKHFRLLVAASLRNFSQVQTLHAYQKIL